MKTIIVAVVTFVTFAILFMRADGMSWADWTNGMACGLMLAYWLVRIGKKADHDE